MPFSVAGIPDLDNKLRSDSAAELLDWLRVGFSVLASEKLVARASAFQPLVLAPERELLGQLGTALKEAEVAGLKGPERVRSVVISHLSTLDAIKIESVEDLICFWQMLASLGCRSSIFAVARKFLEAVLNFRSTSTISIESTSKMAALTHAVVSAVVTSSPLSTVQLSFLNFVRSNRDLWHDSFIELIVDCTLSLDSRMFLRGDGEQAAARKRAWRNLRDTLSDDLRRRSDPDTAVGRALLRSLARYLGISDAPSRTRQEASCLRDKLWALNGARSEPAIERFEPSRRLELA